MVDRGRGAIYTVWPWVIKKYGKWPQAIIVISISVLILLKLFTRYLIPGTDRSTIYTWLHVTRFQCMLIGAFGAILFHNSNALFMKICTNKITQILSWGVILLLVVNLFHIASVLDQEFISVITVFLIIGQCTVKNRIINLEVAFMDFLGKISYGIYIIHPIIIFLFSRVFNCFSISPVIKYPVVYVSIVSFTIFFSYISYNFIEKKFLRIKLKYSIIPSSDSKEVS